MLKPIPARIMRSVVTVKACTGLDRYQNQIYTEYVVKNVHVQPTSEIRKSATNTDETLKSILFVDKKHSTPTIDWWGLFNASHINGGDLKIVVRGQEYTVESVDELRDDSDLFHHWEIGLY